jgi:uncharacterized protein YigA (DUF484 family)
LRETVDQSAATGRLRLSAHDVRSYVLANPEIFVDDVELLAALMPRGRKSSNVLDMQGYVIARLRDEMSTIRQQGQALIEAAASNLLAQERVHSSVLRLMEARSFGHLIRIVSNDIGPLIGADCVTVCIEAPGKSELPQSPPPGIAVLPAGTVDNVLGEDVNHLLNDSRKRLPAVYGRIARRIRSEALVRLDFGGGAPEGLLVCGSDAPETFAPGQRMELLDFLAHAVERAMCGWLGLEEG